MSEVTLDHVLKKAEEGMQAAHAIKTEIMPQLKKVDGIEKLNADLQQKFFVLEKSVSDSIELSQKEAGTRKAMEDQVKAFDTQTKALEAQVKALETAASRAPAGSSEDETKKLITKRNKLFNEFARLGGNGHFDTFLDAKSSADPEIKALTTNSDPSGGYLVMPQFAGVIKTYAYESSPIRLLASSTTIGTDTLEYVLDNDANTSGWVGETATRSETTAPTFGNLKIFVNEMYSNPKVSQKMLDDAGIDIESWLAGKVAEEFGRREATAFVTGTGVAQPKGIMSYTASGASTASTVAAQQIEQVVTGDASNFTYNGLVNLQNSLKETYQPNAVFLIRRASNTNLMQIKDGQGHPIFNMVFDKNVGTQPTIMGQPVYFAADVAAIATNALAMAYGDIRQAYQIVDRIGIRVLRDPYSNKPYVSFYTTKRVGGGVINAEAVKIGKIST
jgi:HK97 family phage major capsid protein